MLNLDRIESEFFRRYPERCLTIDSHTQGEPTRLLVGGTPPLPGQTINAKRQYFESRYDHLRKLLTREPRGHSAIMAAVATEPVTPQGDFGLFFMDSRRYLHLCGHATIGAVVALIETGALEVAGDDPVIVVDTHPARWKPTPGSATAVLNRSDSKWSPLLCWLPTAR